MAKLSAFRQNSRAIREGEWITLPEYDIEVFVRGFTDSYTDTVKLRMGRAAQHHGGSRERIPAQVARSINIEALIEHVVRDVRNLTDDDGQPVPFGTFCDLLRDPDYERLVVAVIEAAQLVGHRRETEKREAADPLAPASGGASNGGLSPAS